MVFISKCGCWSQFEACLYYYRPAVINVMHYMHNLCYAVYLKMCRRLHLKMWNLRCAAEYIEFFDDKSLARCCSTNCSHMNHTRQQTPLFHTCCSTTQHDFTHYLVISSTFMRILKYMNNRTLVPGT